MEDIVIRAYAGKDRDSVRDIAYDTALLGESAEAYFDNRELLKDFLTVSFIDYQPHSCFVAQSGGKVIGYLIGSKNVYGLSLFSRFSIIFKLLIKTITRNVIFRTKNFSFLFNCLISFVKGEFFSPDFSKEYPATLHINIEKAYRNQGIGEKLINIYLDYLIKEGIKGLHFATLSEKAARFYEKLGFVLLYKSKRTYLRSILHKDVDCYIYGKKLFET